MNINIEATKNRPKNIAIFASGKGTIAAHLLETQQKKLKENELDFELKVKIALVVINNFESPLIKVIEEKYPDVGLVITSKNISEYELLRICNEWQIQWIYLCGFMRILSKHFLAHFRHPSHEHLSSVINIHPSLLPKYPGTQGYQKSYTNQDAEGGISIHFVDEGMDTGSIITQTAFPRYKEDTYEEFVGRGKLMEWSSFEKVFLTMAKQGEIYPNSTFASVQPKVEEKFPMQAWISVCLKHRHELVHQVFWIRSTDGEHKNLVSQLKAAQGRILDEVDMDLMIGDVDLSEALKDEEFQIIHFQKGLTDNPANSFCDLLELILERKFEAHSGEIRVSKQAMRKINSMVEVEFISDSDQAREVLIKIQTPHYFDVEMETNTGLSPFSLFQEFKITEMDSQKLWQLSNGHHWALSERELNVIQKHYLTREVESDRINHQLPKDPTDIELEVFAQTWSEHCKHKIFAAKIDYQDSKEEFSVDGIFATYIKAPTEELRKTIPWAISVFKDNAGIVRFHDELDFCIKVETHNSPSALDPYGGALTGLLGVHRDILGTGLGAKPVANTDVLLFGEPTFPEGKLPIGLHHPKEILKGVHKGIQDAGNKSGIPTINGAIHFDNQYCGKPIVYCGAIGMLPKSIKGIPTHEKGHRPGDYIVMVGGAVGLDGIHGATSSSLGMDEKTPVGMVQIGDPFTQKKMLDFILAARDEGIYNSITDNGAGGLSSSVGEMAEKTGGARIDLSKVPLKYPGLKPWQIFVSESQERMTVSVPKESWDALKKLSIKYDINADVVGEFNDSGYLDLFYKEVRVGRISIHFLHKGLPQMELKAKWDGPKKLVRWDEQGLEVKKNAKQKKEIGELIEVLVKNPTIASKEPWVRQFDSEVQSATVLKPYGGLRESFPNNAGVIWPGAYGASGYTGVAVASGLCPQISEIDTELMALMACDEAVRNLIVTGVDPDWIALVDNFCWPDPIKSEKNPDGAHKLAQLVRCGRGIQKFSLCFRMPLVSGKDSMKNDFYGKDSQGNKTTISALPTLLMTAIGKHPNVKKVISNQTSLGSKLYLLDSIQDYKHYFGTFLSEHLASEDSITQMAQLNNSWDLKQTLELYREFYRTSQIDLIEGAIDLSEGGLAISIFEMLLGKSSAKNRLGASINLDSIKDEAEELNFLFSELPGRILVSVRPENAKLWESSFDPKACRYLGEVTERGFSMELTKSAVTTRNIDLSQLEVSYRGIHAN